MNGVEVNCGFCGCEHNIGECAGPLVWERAQAATVAAIVAWLRETECTCESLDCPHPSIVCDRATAIRLADAIERGEHMKGGK